MNANEISQRQDGYRKPLPITPLNKPFWDFAARSIFALQTCDACGDAHVPPSPVCPRCLSANQTWKPASGRGTLESWADFHRAYWDGFKEELPYRTCLVKLDEGPLIISNLVGDDAKTRVSARLRVTFERATDDIAIPHHQAYAARSRRGPFASFGQGIGGPIRHQREISDTRA